MPYRLATPQKNDDTMLIVLIFITLYNLSLPISTIILPRIILDRELKMVAESCRMGFVIQIDSLSSILGFLSGFKNLFESFIVKEIKRIKEML